MSNNCNYKYNGGWYSESDVKELIRKDLIKSGSYDSEGNIIINSPNNSDDSLFGIGSENKTRLENSSMEELSIKDYLNVDTQSELMEAIRESKLKLKTFFDISLDASVLEVYNFMYNGIFSIGLIPSNKLDEFIDNARKYLNGGTFSYEYHSLFNKIGNVYIANFLYNNYYIKGNTVFANGESVGEFKREEDGSYSMNDMIIPDFVSIMSDKTIVINSSNTNVVSKLKDLGYNTVINDGKMIVSRPINMTVVGSVQESSEILDQIRTNVHKISNDFFGNVKASNRVVNPFISMLLNSSNMTLDQIIELIQDSIDESVSYIEKVLAEANEFVNVDVVTADVFSDIHVIEDELMPLLYGFISVLDTANKTGDYKHHVDKAIKRLGVIEPMLMSFSNIYTKAVENHLQSKYGFSIDKFNSEYSRGSKDISPIYYYIKYPESSKNYSVRLAVAILQTIKTDESLDFGKYDKISKLVTKIKSGSYSDVFAIYERDDNNNATGFLIGKVNWGKFSDALDTFLKYLSDPTAKSSGYSASGLYDRDVSQDHWAEYRSDVNKWLKTHTESPMDESYLDAIASLSKDTYIQYIDSRSHLTSLFSRISGYDIANDTPIYKEFINAYRNYLYLFSMYDFDGSLKKYSNAKMHKIAIELNKFHDIFNPGESESSSSKFDDFMDELHKLYVSKKISATEFRKRRKILSGFTSELTSKKNKDAEESALGNLIKIFTSNGMDNNAFSNASIDRRKLMVDMFVSDGFEPYFNGYTEESPEFSRTVKYYRNKYGESRYIQKMEEDYVTVPNSDGAIPNPLFFIFLPKSKDISKPSPIFALDHNTFNANPSNSKFDPESPYSLSPNPALYSNDKFDLLTDRQRELVDDVLEILIDINKNNGTISMYGPLFPQISSTGTSRLFRAMQSGMNPLSAIAFVAKTKWTYNNESLSSVIGFKKEANIPVSLFAKNSQRLIEPNTISRDLILLLSRGYSDSLITKHSSKYMYALKSVVDRSKNKNVVNNPGASSLIASIIRKFVGTEDILEGGHKKGQWNVGAIVSSMLNSIRKIYLSFKWLPIMSNMVNASIVTMSDSTFVNRKYLISSTTKAADSVLRFCMNKFTGSDIADSKIVNMMLLSGVLSSEAKYNAYYGSRFGKFIAENFWLGGFSISDIMSKFPLAETVFNGIKYYNGEFLHKYEYIEKYADRNDDGIINNKSRRSALSRFNKLNKNLYDAFTFDKNGVYTLNHEFIGTNALDALSTARAIIMKKHKLVAGNKENSLSPTLDNVFSPQIFMYKGWLINAINNYLNPKYYNPVIKETIESQYVSFYKMLLRAMTYVPVMGEMMREYIDQDTGVKSDRRYLSQYQIDNGKQFVNTFFAMIGSLLTSVVISSLALQAINNLANGDDDDDKELSLRERALIAAATLITRVGNELLGMHTLSMNDVFNSISSTGNPLVSLLSLVGRNVEDAQRISRYRDNLTEEEQAEFEQQTGISYDRRIFEEYLSFLPGGPGYLSTNEMLFGNRGSYKQLRNSRKYNEMFKFLDKRYREIDSDDEVKKKKPKTLRKTYR